MTRKLWQRWTTNLLLAAVTGPLAGGCHCLLLPPPVAWPPPPPTVCPDPALTFNALAPGGSEGKNGPGTAGGNAKTDSTALPIDLLTALRLADDKNAEIAVARERIRQAYAQQQQAEVLWLPNLEAAPIWNRHDGQIQRATGQIITVSRSSLFTYGGPTLTVELGDACFAPLAARQLTRAFEARAAAITNARVLDVALAYTDWLQAHADLQINAETLANAQHLLKLMESFERSGKAAAADTARSRTEVFGREAERLEIQGRIGVIEARLTELLRLAPGTCLRPADLAVTPVALVPEQICLHDLVAQALTTRPELAENQSVAQAALERWRGAKVAPWLPQLRLSLASGGFGGGINSDFSNFSGRTDVAVGAVWELQNLGLGNLAAIKARHSEYAQAVFAQAGVEARVSAEVMSAFSVAFARRRTLDVAQKGVAAARESYKLNEQRIRRAPEQGRPIELLQAIQALARARQEYLAVVADYNRAQFRLYTALGNPPLCALNAAVNLPVTEPTAPAVDQSEPAPAPRRQSAAPAPAATLELALPGQ